MKSSAEQRQYGQDRSPDDVRHAPNERSYSLRGKRVWVAGHRGMVGSALLRRLAHENCHCITVDRDAVDLRRQAEVEAWIRAERPQAVFLAAARVGGILANAEQPAAFLYDNLLIAANIVHAAAEAGVEKLLFLGSSCIYPRAAPQPMAEEALLTGPLEPTNRAYAIAKIAGLELCRAYRSERGCDFIAAMPTNLYGPGDNFNLREAHVVPALMRRVHEAKIAGTPEVVVWGSGRPRREFLHVDDLADACVFLMKHFSDPVAINIGWGRDLTIAELVEILLATVGFDGTVRFDTRLPDGTPRKLLDCSRLRELGWRAKIELADGLAVTYRWFVDNLPRLRHGFADVR